MKVLTVKESTFKTAATFILNASFDDLQKFLARHAEEDAKPLPETHRTDNGLMLTMKNKRGEPCYVVWVKKFDWNVRDMAILAHEIVHLAIAITDDKGIQVRAENGEVLAYLHEYYMTRTFWPLRKFSPTFKRKKSKRAA